jgi:DNA-binding NarL/FixJ family response regulator
MKIDVVLVDDHAVVREGLRFVLEAQRDLRVVGEAADGLQGVRLAKELQPDIVVMDIAMPGLNGIEATRQISESCPGTRVIVLSMHSTDEHVLQALRAGARGYVVKESAGVELVAAVRTTMSGARYLSQKISEKVLDAFAQPVSEENQLLRLSEREREVLQLVVEGRSSREIAELLCLSAKTVDTYRARVMRKLEINDIPGLVKFAIRHGLTGVD